VVRSNQPVAISDLQNDARFARDVAEDTGYVPQALLAVPVSVEDHVLGVLTLLDRDEARPGAEQDMALLAVFADQTALTLQSERAFSDLGRMLLAAVAEAADGDADLATAVARAAADGPPEDVDLAELAALFAALDRQGPEERRLAVRLVREVAAYTGRRSSRPRR
jgi:GAF domain-containing protein